MTAPEAPFGLLAELTYRCPLACAYCSNPLEMAAYDDELSTSDWQRVFAEAAAKWLTGNEPFTAKLVPEYAPYAEYDQLMRRDEWYGRVE